MVATTNIKIAYRPRNWAKKLHTASIRWIVLIIHRRGGKTTAAFNHLQRDALNNPNTRYAYLAPTYKQAKRIVWKMAQQYAKGVPAVKFNSSELLITYANGSEIMIVGANQPDSLRGIALWGCFLDEYPQISPIVFTEIITKCLADHEGYCIFGGTPKGKGHFYRIYQVALKNPDRWLLVYKTIDESLKDEKGDTIDALRRSLEEDRQHVKDGLMTQDEFMQEWYNSFEASIKGAVYREGLADMRKKNRISGGMYDRSLPVYTVWDLGISKSDAMSIGFFQRVGKEMRLVDYYENTGLGFPHYVQILQQYSRDKGYVYGKHFAPHDIKHKELMTGLTRLETARKLGFEFEVTPSLGIEDGIDLARAMITRLWVDKENCEAWLDLIGQYHYEFDERRGILTKVPVHDFSSHAADMFRYAAVVEDEMVIEKYAQPPRHEAVDDEYVGQEAEDDDYQEGMGRHPDMRGVNIGAMGHKK